MLPFYGLNISKIITSIFGGMVTTDDKSFAAKIFDIRNEMLTLNGLAHSLQQSLYLVLSQHCICRPIYGVVNKLERLGLLNRFVKYYDEHTIDLPKGAARLGGIEARLVFINAKNMMKLSDTDEVFRRFIISNWRELGI